MAADDIDERTLAYIAGFFDGEGCVSFARVKTSHYIRVLIANTDIAVLQYIQSIFGGDIQKMSRREANWKQGFYLRISWSKAIDFLTAIYPWLRVKQQQAELAFAWDAGRLGRGAHTATEMRDHEEVIMFLRDHLHWLNARGVDRASESPLDACLRGIEGYDPAAMYVLLRERHPDVFN